MNKYILLSILFSNAAYASGGAGINYFNQTGNLIIFLILLIFFTRKPIMKAIRDRARGIRNEIEDSQTLLETAEADFSTINTKLESIATHIEELRSEAQNDALDLKKEMKVRGEEEAVRIRQSAEQSIQEQLRRAKRELKEEAVNAAVEIATQAIRQNINDDDQRRLNGDFISTLQEGATDV
jgi:F-type H+-transporting ATPase subunit b